MLNKLSAFNGLRCELLVSGNRDSFECYDEPGG